ncbi:MAG TPA: TrmH family RNA methyltransferase [Chthonomonadaceae bacterium]|nr:TrmH family RNA methyltransferase [Chthonomonadaceae bacterium]
MPHASNPLTLIGEEIAGEWNTTALANIAQAFGGDYLPYNGQAEEGEDLDTASAQGDLLRSFDCLIAAENRPDARNIYAFRPQVTGRRALLVGNEAKGLRRRTLKQAHAVAEIPLVSKNINCLNVAAAAAIMLYYLHLPEPLPQKRRTLASLQKSRPDILLIGGSDAMELGSAIRSTCAFGWERLFLLDRGNAWYECDRIIKSEGRGAARRGRNPIKILPYRDGLLTSYRRRIVFTTDPQARRPQSLSLAEKDTLIVLEDTPGTAASWFEANGDTQEVVYAALPPVAPDRYHFRQMASIALAEIARQLGQPDGEGIYLRSRKQRYRKEIEAESVTALLDLTDLACF